MTVRLIGAQLWHRRGRSLALLVGVMVAAVSFSLLTASASTTAAHVRHTVGNNSRSTYDILVRPAGSTTSLENSRGLVQANYLSGIFGGISFAQWHAIEQTSGVSVAAPIAMVGYVMPAVSLPIDLDSAVTSANRQVFRVQMSWQAQDGLSRFDAPPTFVYVTRNTETGQPAPYSEVAPDLKGAQPTCSNFQNQLPTTSSPFETAARTVMSCYFVSGGKVDGDMTGPPLLPNEVGATVTFVFPFLLAAIDPVQEAKLVSLDHTVTTGRYLEEGDAPQVVTPKALSSLNGSLSVPEIPVLAASQPVVDDKVQVNVQRLTGLSTSQIATTLLGKDPFGALSSANGTNVFQESLASKDVYQRVVAPASSQQQPLLVDAYWSGAPNRYQQDPDGSLTATTESNPSSIWASALGGYVDVPLDNDDTAFRALTEHVGSKISNGGVLNLAALNVVGQFDVAKLPGVNPLTAVPLSTYNLPTATAGDAASKALLGGKSLSPDENLAGYLQSPPLLLTDLNSLSALTNPAAYSGTNPSAPISAIRIRVGDLHGGTGQQLAQIGRVAVAIKKATGLQVDVTAGSSPTSVTVNVAAGKHGRPALTLAEPWVDKGVAVGIFSAVDRKSAALFALVLVVTGCFIANGAFAAARARRSELGVLRCLGWTPRAIVRLVVGELGMLGGLAGILGAGLSAALIAALQLRMPLARALLVIPVAVVLTVIAGLIPAWRAGRGQPLDAITPPIVYTHRARPTRGLVGLGLTNLRRMPGRTALAALALAIGVAALTVLLDINLTFTTTSGGSALGGVITQQVRTVDYVSAALAITLGAASVADVLYLNLRERAPERAALAATGWRRQHLRRVSLIEAAGIGAAGSVVGAVAGLITVAGLGGVSAGTAIAAVSCAAIGIIVALLASRAVVAATDRGSLAATLAEE